MAQPPAEQLWKLWQAAHWAPPLPQLRLLVPDMHVPAGVQQPLQLPGPQAGAAGLHNPLIRSQLSPLAWQSTQLAPLMPHSLSLTPPWHWPLPSQQPHLQLAGPQLVAPWQLPEARSQVLPPAAQSTQLPPPLPQAPSPVPGLHCPAASQQPLQLPGLQAGGVPWQVLLVASQVWPVAAQSTQPLPPPPQAEEVLPGRHWLLSQHPPPQPDGPQVGVPPLHVPAAPSQVAPKVLQSTQLTPPMPQVLSLLPATQVLLAQQPLQEPGPQLGGALSQVPLAPLQDLPWAAQSTQATPPLPHRSWVLPWKHCLLSQQPLQLALLQPVPPWQVLLGQVPPLWVQSMQSAPALPQAVALLPARQRLLLQQPPGQLIGPQPPAGGMHCPDWQTSLPWQTTQGKPAVPQACVVVWVMHWA